MVYITVISPADDLLGSFYMVPSTSRTAYPSNRIIVTESLVEPILRLLEQNCKANTAKLQYDRPEMVHPFTLTRIFIVQRALLAPLIGIYTSSQSLLQFSNVRCLWTSMNPVSTRTSQKLSLPVSNLELISILHNFTTTPNPNTTKIASHETISKTFPPSLALAQQRFSMVCSLLSVQHTYIENVWNRDHAKVNIRALCGCHMLHNVKS